VTALSIEDLHAGYGETRVLSGLSLSVDEGTVHALVGRNGAGKTTTLRSVMGAVVPDSGRIVYGETDVTDIEPTATAKLGIGFVPEERRVFPGLTVAENLKIAGHGGAEVDHEWSVRDVFDSFERLQERKGQRATTLSGGEQQMLAIARALVAGADLLLLDEPTEGLAPTIVQQVEDIVTDLRDEGITVLLVEQNLAAALAVADRVSILDHGEVVFEGTPAELEDRPDVRDRHLGVSL
jgi:branched-chain amino acid transport system ATP-binding protein